MNAYEFIFSNHLRHRIARHAIFWLIWWCYFIFSYYLPYFWFFGWRIDPAQLAQTQELGYFKFSLFVIVNTFIGSITHHVLFTYPILYYLIPRYLYTSRYWALLTSLVIISVLTIVVAFYKLIWYYNPLLISFGIPAVVIDKPYFFYCNWTNILFNCPTVAALAVGIKLFKYYYLKGDETDQIAKEKAKAELTLLKAQVHPHFLFNTLNNIYFFSMTSSAKAAAMLKKLSGMLHFILNEGNKTFVPLEAELKMIQDYMALEKIRYGDRLNMNVSIMGDPANKLISPLLFIPFVENSFKHGASRMLTHPWITLQIEISNKSVQFKLINSRFEDSEYHTHNGGIGLSNVTKRLELLYPKSHKITITKDPLSYSVYLEVQLKESHAPEVGFNMVKAEYEMA